MKAKLIKDVTHRLDGEIHVFPKELSIVIVESAYGPIMETDSLRFLIREDEYGTDEAA